MVRAVSDPRDVSVGPNQHSNGSSYRTEHRELPRTSVSSVDPLDPIRPWGDVERAGLSVFIVVALSQATGRPPLPLSWNAALAVLLFVVVLAASYGPARRAGNVPPSLAIKNS